MQSKARRSRPRSVRAFLHYRPSGESFMAGIERATAIGRRVPSVVRSRLEDHLRQASEQLDDVQREVTQGIRDARHFDELEEKFERACATGRCGFRGSPK